ncbi:hypothetical protein I6A84_21420 [Frankia sp. CNm7]|uniref:Uncharacterized protein n=1 Tax=Frankia nepalensis TaxID=1836974 RepID=A0A937RKZ7_9ACTN|nr:hypothetical protein [Frankia nepalensis]MBL7498954.1 hypothetical protein [Frankia nepalensis]MBL7511249.1 hypothetical protein [Frankia nepalensis]MBL7520577.1 hypothetical protein [Frankia nepalensis]MBL7630769.1 hypothetical protein [Frankia nepalensis]
MSVPSTRTFAEHFTTALWLGAAFSAVGIIAAAAVPGRHDLTSIPAAATGGKHG